MNKKQLEIIPEDLSQNIKEDALIQNIIIEDRKDFQPGIETLETHTNRIREEINSAMQLFKKNFQSGYQIICDELNALRIPLPIPSDEQLEILDHSNALMEALKSGKELYQLLGFSDETMQQCYERARQLAEERNFEKAHDAFYFLVVVAPNYSAFWMGFGLCCDRLQNYGCAVEAYRHSIELDGENGDACIGCLHAMLHENKKEEALELCNHRIEFTLQHGDKEWAKSLKSTLEGAKQFIQTTQ